MAYPAHEPTCRLPVRDDLRLTPRVAPRFARGPLSAQESLIGTGVLRLSAPSPCLYRVTVPVNVWRTGELSSGTRAVGINVGHCAPRLAADAADKSAYSSVTAISRHVS